MKGEGRCCFNAKGEGRGRFNARVRRVGKTEMKGEGRCCFNVLGRRWYQREEEEGFLRGA